MKVEIYMTENDVHGADHQQVTVKLLVYLLLDFVVHVGSIVRVELVNHYLIRQLDLHKGKVKVQFNAVGIE